MVVNRMAGQQTSDEIEQQLAKCVKPNKRKPLLNWDDVYLSSLCPLILLREDRCKKVSDWLPNKWMVSLNSLLVSGFFVLCSFCFNRSPLSSRFFITVHGQEKIGKKHYKYVNRFYNSARNSRNRIQVENSYAVYAAVAYLFNFYCWHVECWLTWVVFAYLRETHANDYLSILLLSFQV